MTRLLALRLLAVIAMLLGALSLPGCERNGDGSGGTPPPKSIALADLIVDPAKLPYVTDEGHTFYRFEDIRQFHDFQEGMKNPWLIEGSDLENGKFVFHNLTCQEKPGIVSTNSDLGLCWHADATYPADGFYTGECISTMFCLIPFGNQEVPTVYVDETLRFLPLWKERLLEHSGASDAYFRDHFYVHSTFVSQEGDGEVLTVRYYFQVDWLTLLETTSTRIRTGTGSGYLEYEQIKPVTPTATATPTIAFRGDYLEDEQIKAGFSINLTHPIEHIATREAIAASLDEQCAPGMRLIEDDVRIDDRGRLTLAAWSEIDRAASKCKHATVDLESGEILGCQDSVCWVD